MTIIHGDCLAEMRKMEANSITGIVTDPPYMLNFMNKSFDKFDGNPAANMDVWKEALRITKPGGHLLAFGGDRTHHHLMVAIENAGWEIRTCLYWIFGSGFPKSHNFGKRVGGEWAGYGTALKPAAEIIVMAMKPCDGTFAQNASKWAQAGINVDGCRIGNEMIKTNSKIKGESFTHLGKGEGFNGCEESIHKGRWPANLILNEESARLVDEQSGVSKSSAALRNNKARQGESFGREYNRIGYGHSDSGGASRFFYCPKASSAERNAGCEGLELRSKGAVDGANVDNTLKGPTNSLRPNESTKCQNNHPTVKPIKLMEYLIKLIAPPKDALLLDPFMGSGTTLLAAHNLGINCIGIEQSADYCEIARARLDGSRDLFTSKN